jgi:pyruvate formate lyase activating enzyme
MGRVHSVETLGALDGPGLRYVLFLQGCPLRCMYCHNPDTWNLEGGTCTGVEEQANDILRYKSYLTGGLTISGGEPLVQASFVRELIKSCHSRAGLHCAIDTSGAIDSQEAMEAIDEADMILLDIKAFDDDVATKLTGTDTAKAWQILQHCEATNKPVWIRHVLVPGITIFEKDAKGAYFTEEKDFLAKNPQLSSGAERLSALTCVERTDLLPYHKMGEFKWEELRMPCGLSDTPEPQETSIRWAEQIFSDRKQKSTRSTDG